MLKKKTWLMLLGAFLFGSLLSCADAQESNRNQVRKRVAQGGWHPVYGELVNEAEYAKVTAELYSGSVGDHFNDDLHRTIEKMVRMAPDVSREALLDAVKRALKDRGRSFHVGKIAVKGGIARYQRNVYIYVPAPLGNCTVFPRPKGVKKRIRLPNHYQPYVAFRIYSQRMQLDNR